MECVHSSLLFKYTLSFKILKSINKPQSFRFEGFDSNPLIRRRKSKGKGFRNPNWLYLPFNKLKKKRSRFLLKSHYDILPALYIKPTNKSKKINKTKNQQINVLEGNRVSKETIYKTAVALNNNKNMKRSLRHLSREKNL